MGDPQHNQRKTESELTGQKLKAYKFTVTLDAQYGVKPREMLANIQRMAEEGTVDYLIIGSDPVGMCLFKLTDASDAWDCVAAGGRLVRCKIDLSFEEYA